MGPKTKSERNRENKRPRAEAADMREEKTRQKQTREREYNYRQSNKTRSRFPENSRITIWRHHLHNAVTAPSQKKNETTQSTVHPTLRQIQKSIFASKNL
jgi:hypothetical protein